MHTRIHPWLVSVIVLFSLSHSYSYCAPGASNECHISYLQGCARCSDLRAAVDLKNPDQGEYYRGACWNGLYAAFRLNCQALGKTLLEHHANPNPGGNDYMFLISLAGAWPHNDSKINLQWLALIKPYGINVNWKPTPSSESAVQIVANTPYPIIDYPDIWQKILANNKAKP